MALYFPPLILEGGLIILSCWWRGVSLLGDPKDAISDWFSEGVTKNVGNGRMTSFWFGPRLGGIPLKTQFQRLFQVSTQSTNMMSEMGNWVEGQWVWDLRWRRDLFVWELNLLESFREILDRAIISTADDSWYWKHDSSGFYSVKSAFLELSRSRDDDATFSVEEERLLPKVWKTWAPTKVAVFSWQLLQDRLPTRQNLWQRGVIEDVSASMCVLCGLGLESADHLFGSCNLISPIWYSILRWLCVELVPSRGVLGFFEAFLGMGTGRKDRVGWLLIWHTIVWTIWKSRNDVVFSEGTFIFECLVDRVKLLSWKWFLGKNPDSPCSFYEWGIHPTLCWNR
ncbi:hypothetical protein TSUD_235480 [Trifolium subterraneum]|nr:hypothetical protein TSUD_235480 [Trifolium subterraneum]